MIINLVYDSSANNAPASFKAAMQQAAAILDAAITDPITVTIKSATAYILTAVTSRSPTGRLRAVPTPAHSSPIRKL